eukprot:TRINITY_DN22818_c0_g1_i2.p1 TRINITY_DN22818_c0_g1~~TRINITY_DN22818_c0_g1_i2.p1  ORF type:complete len:466 (-),score=92.90 TRINITY_DN22818_c0_g1_i2:211-1608(-)
MGLLPSALADAAIWTPEPDWRSPCNSRGPSSSARWKRPVVSEATIFDTYDIDGLLGSGLFGQVRSCRPLSEPKRRCAVKIVDTKGEVFQHASKYLSAHTEAAILQSIEHPHIVQLLDVFEQERWLFLVMECVGGGELFTAFADPRTVLTESCVMAAGRQVLQALQHLHERRIVHRDVKAENILLAVNPAKTGRWHVKLIDFGLAMRMEQQQQQSCFLGITCRDQGPLEELICGTAYYCSPEVWVNDYSPKVDVWAVGVVLYLALHGCFPFYNADPTRLEAMICADDVKPAYQPAKAKDSEGYQVSREARQCLEALLLKDQDDRPTAERAQQLPWLYGGSRSGSEVEQQLPIPLSVRSKAARAAERPPVDLRTERARTSALENLKARVQYAAAVKRSSKGDDSNSGSSTTTRESDLDQLPVLSWDGHDVAPADTSLSDSDVEDDAVMCTCGRARLSPPASSDIRRG